MSGSETVVEFADVEMAKIDQRIAEIESEILIRQDVIISLQNAKENLRVAKSLGIVMAVEKYKAEKDAGGGEGEA